MKNEEVKKWVENVNKKLGKEAAGKIADDLGKLITDTDIINKELEKKDKTIESLENDHEMLLSVNSSLLQQVGEIDEPEDDIHKGKKEKEEHKPYNFRDSFDEYGNFKM